MNLPIHFAQTQTQKLTDAHTGSEIKKKVIIDKERSN